MIKNEFDDIVRKHMNDLKVAPSSELKRALAFKLFFRNIVVFHKVKMIAAIALITTGTIIAVNYSSKEGNEMAENEVNVELEINKPNTVSTNEIVINETEIIETIDNNEEKAAENAVPNNESTESFVASTSDEIVSKESNITEKTSELNKSTFEEEVVSNQNRSHQKNTTNTASDQEDNIADNSLIEDGISKNEDLASSTAINEEVTSVEVIENKQRENISISKVETIESGIETEIVKDCSQPDLSSFDGDYASKKASNRGFSFDVYVNPYGKNKIDNELDSFYEEYWWDWHKDFETVKSGIGAGINVNYQWNGFKLSSGINLNTIYDYRPTYRYSYDDYLVSYGGDAISGVYIYEIDTALVFYVDPDDSETIEEIENDHNKYSYINIPLTAGYEFNTKFFSLELGGGIEYGRLAGAKGVGVFKGEVDENPYPDGYVEETYTVYYYRNKMMETMDRKSSILQKNTLGYIANATLRVHINGNLDVFSSIKYKQSLNGLYQNNYMLQKNYNSYGLNFGVTYNVNKRIKSAAIKFN